MGTDSFPERYLEFIRNSERLFQPLKPLKWGSKDEHPLVEIRLSNGMLVNIDINTRPVADFRIAASYPEGCLVQPVSHFLEHMLTDPQGIGYLPDKLQGIGVSYEGLTNHNFTRFGLSAAKAGLLALQEVNSQAVGDLVSLLFGMTIAPEINDEVVERERKRLEEEFRGRQDDAAVRLGDYILPLTTVGQFFCTPTPETELKFTTRQIKAAHAQRQNSNWEIEVSGSYETRVEAEATLEQTFGRLPTVEGDTNSCLLPVKMFDYGSLVKVISASDLARDYFGLTAVIKEDERSHERLAQRTFEWVLSQRVHSLLQRVSYESADEGDLFNSQGYQIAFINVTTQSLNEANFLVNGLIDSLASCKIDDDLKALYEVSKRAMILDLFGSPSFRRMNTARQLGFSTEGNCQALYQAIVELPLAEVVAVGRDLVNQGVIGLLHYGSRDSATLDGFQQVAEEDLIKAWKAAR